jgi:hypothetical protein
MGIPVAVKPLKLITANSGYSQLLRLSSRISLKVMKFDNCPVEQNRLSDILLLPGLGSVYENFHETVEALSERHAVYFLETREKGSSVISGKAGFSIP